MCQSGRSSLWGGIGVSGSILAELESICGPGAARAGRPDDSGAGFVASPATPRSVAELLHIAVERGLSVRPRGSGSKFHWGRGGEHPDLVIDTGRLNGMWDHDGATAIVAAGTRVEAAQAVLRSHGRRLTLDPPSPGATIGGVLAMNESGPLRHRFGGPAGQALSVSLVDSAGRFAETAEWEGPSGEVLTAALLPLEDLPEARRWVTRPVSTPTEVGELVAQVVTQDLALSGVEVDLPAAGTGTLALLLEGPAAGVATGAGRLARQLGPRAVIRAEPPQWWGRYSFGVSDVVLRIRVRSRDLHSVGYTLRDVVGLPVPVRGSAGAGVVHAVLPRGLSAARIGDVVVALKQVLLGRGGRVVVLTAPPELAAQMEMARPTDLL
ncbi:FAD-dependent oxidoreductase [Actinoplanes hulinensis]|uniref:FAD-dependent oxidoreductase n=1 Tax=Actinoplanes hulinensis TaxID=1144547 RepID=A0ABS7B9P9_9ACTN|nr:FAD-dependent oxidoreductase [Actinoplanes hulinensis]